MTRNPLRIHSHNPFLHNQSQFLDAGDPLFLSLRVDDDGDDEDSSDGWFSRQRGAPTRPSGNTLGRVNSIY